MFDFNSLIELKESFAFESYDLYQWESVIDYRFKQFESKTTKKKERKKSNFYHFNRNDFQGISRIKRAIKYFH